MHLIGIVSNSKPTLEQIAAIARQSFDANQFQFTTFLYENTSEIRSLVQSHKNTIIAWIFSGETPYRCAKPYLDEGTPAVHCIINGIEFYRYLLYCLQFSPVHRLRVSIDTPIQDKASWNELLEQLNIGEKSFPADEVYLCPYDSLRIDEEIERVTQRHIELVYNKKVDSVLTSSTKVYGVLKRAGLPVYQVHGSTFTIRNAMLKLSEQLMERHIIRHQVAVIRIGVTDLDEFFSRHDGSLQIQMLDMRIKRHILEMCQALHNSYLSQKDSGRYEIFASRSVIEENLSAILSTIEDIRLYTNTEMSVGIGYGSTTGSAQHNAIHAILYGRAQTPVQKLTIIDDTGMIQENIGTKEALTYQPSTNDPALLAKLDRAGVGIKNYAKVNAIAQRIGRPFTSAELAAQMGVTERNARRILAALLTENLIACVGEESLTRRGRPSKKYVMSNPDEPPAHDPNTTAAD